MAIARTFSFRTFLKTGQLGQVRPGLTMMEVARELGPPESWILQPNDVVPTYWAYGHLEILFDLPAPHRLRWFQIEHADSLKGEGPFFGDGNSTSISMASMAACGRPISCVGVSGRPPMSR